MKRALICGISGQDGSYLAKILLEKGYQVAGTSRDADANPFPNLVRLGLRDRVSLSSMAPDDLHSTLQVVERFKPDEIYNLAGPSSVGLSFDQPVEALKSIAGGALNLLEAVRLQNRPIRLFNACSSECFGNTGSEVANEDTAFRPESPYAIAKAAAFWFTANYRVAFGVWTCSGILFNHESPLRPERFVVKKIVASACRIAGGSRERLRLGSLDIVRDWGWAPEYVEAMWRMLQADLPRDYVVASGSAHTLEDVVCEVFAACGLDWKSHVDLDPQLARPLDPAAIRADPSRIAADLGWRAKCKLPEIASHLIAEEQRR